LSTVSHLSGQVLRLRLSGNGGVLEPTALHRFYSLDREAWVMAGELRIGEELATRDGAVLVESLEEEPAVQRVYNLEVDVEHLYLVGDAGVVSHNTCAQGGGGKPVIHEGKQGKHIPGHNNFQNGKSELTHKDPQGLLDKHGGTGVRHGNKEVVDFKQEIGVHVDQQGNRSATTRGTIHYDNSGGAHIVPARPDPSK
jgi:filamentous hemagglutinin